MRFIACFSLRKFLIVAASVVSLFPAAALAQDARGKFTLTTEVHWGQVVLPAGDYRYSLENHSGFNTIAVWNSAGAPSFLMLPNSISSAAGGQPDRLNLTRRGEAWFVESLVLPEAEMTVHFRVPPATSELAREQGPRKTISMVSP